MEEEKRCATWQIPNIGVKAPKSVVIASVDVDNKKLELLKETSKKQGYEQGLQQGLAQAQEKTQHLIAELQQQVNILADPLKQIDTEIENIIVELSMAIARQVVGYELSHCKDGIAKTVKEAIDCLPIHKQKIQLHLNPEDVEFVKAALASSNQQQQLADLHIVEDQSLAVGGCKINTETAMVDASVENRFKQVLEQLFSNGEQGDAESDPAVSAH